MAILVEALSVVVKIDSINTKFLGGMNKFYEIVPNSTFCADDHLVRVGFMNPVDVQGFIDLLEERGLKFLRKNFFVDIAVVDQLKGPTMPVKWLGFGNFHLNDSPDSVAASWWVNNTKKGKSAYEPPEEIKIATPEGWEYENSLSEHTLFVHEKEAEEKVRFLRHEEGVEVYLDLATGNETFVGRPNLKDIRSI